MAGASRITTQGSARNVGGRTVGFGIDVRGIPEVQEMLRSIDDGPESRRALQRASTAGAKALKPFVKAAAPRGATGKLKRSISSRQARRDRPAAVVSARPRIAFYRHMVIGGTKPHRIRFPDQKAAGVPKTAGNIEHPGSPANPFIERGFEAGQATAERAIDAVITKFLESV